MAAAAEAKFHVLAVDDSIIDRKLIERLLRSSSYQVTTVDSGSKALEFLGLRDDVGDSNSESLNNQEIDVSLVITDYCMPGMSGYDLLKRIKETSPLKNIPVVVMSSENVPSRISRCLEEGAEEFFLKPMRISYINKLAPHIMKGKQREEEQQQLPEKIGGQEASAVASAPPANQSGVGYKRKASSEGDAAVERSLSPDRTRQRVTVTA